MTTRCGVQKIDDILVNNVNDLFRNCMNEEQYIEVTKKECTAKKKKNIHTLNN